MKNNSPHYHNQVNKNVNATSGIISSKAQVSILSTAAVRISQEINFLSRLFSCRTDTRKNALRNDIH